MNECIKRKIMDKKVACKSFKNHNKNYDAYLKLRNISTERSERVLKRKDDYHTQLSDKLNPPEISAKEHLPILKALYNGKKIPLIPPILVNNKLKSNFKEKANHSNAFFASQCTPIWNDSTIHNTINSVSAQSYDNISVRLLKICDSSMMKPLSKIFKNCLQTGTLPNNWKKSNVVPIHEKGDKQLLQNYRPAYLLPI